MAPSVHDNLLLSYSVDAQNETILFHTEYPYGENPERTDIIFTGVVIYHFESDNLKTIIFDVEETTLEATYIKHQSLFQRLKNHGWPHTSYNDRDELLSSMQAQGVSAFEISSSYGLNGFVWAQNMVKHPAHSS